MSQEVEIRFEASEKEMFQMAYILEEAVKAECVSPKMTNQIFEELSGYAPQDESVEELKEEVREEIDIQIEKSE